jgi:hypothetical protein
MRFKSRLVMAVLLLSGLPAVAAQPGPAGLKAAAPEVVAKVAAPRHCEWRQGQRFCRADPTRGARRSDYFEYDAKTLPFGTEPWRDQMRRENRLGNPG